MTNVCEMARILNDKWSDHLSFIARQKRLCEQNGQTWTNPPAYYTTNGVTLTSVEWGTMILYNGGGTNSIPLSEGLLENGNPSKLFRSPWKYYPDTQTWILYDNDQKYLRKITDGMNLVNTNGVIIVE